MDTIGPLTPPPRLPAPARSEFGAGRDGRSREPQAACAAWSRHAADLAEPVAAAVYPAPETPTTAVMVADGLLVRLLPGTYLPPDLLGSAVGRALAVGCALGARLRPDHVVAGASAAWVVLGGPPPAGIELFSTTHRATIPGVTVRSSLLVARDVETLGGVPVTVPARTGADLLRSDPDAARLALVAELVRSGHTAPRAIAERLARLPRHPRAPEARRSLRSLREELEHGGPVADAATSTGVSGTRSTDRPRATARRRIIPPPRGTASRADGSGAGEGAPDPPQTTVSGSEAPTALPSAVTRYTS